MFIFPFWGGFDYGVVLIAHLVDEWKEMWNKFKVPNLMVFEGILLQRFNLVCLK